MEKDPQHYLDLARAALEGNLDAQNEIEKIRRERAGIDFKNTGPEKTDFPDWMIKQAENKDKGTPPSSR